MRYPDKKKKYVEVILATNVSATGVITALTISNLRIGKTYEMKGVFDLRCNSASNSLIFVENGTSTVALIENRDNQSTAQVTRPTLNIMFPATDPSLTFRFQTVSGAGLVGTGTKQNTYVQVLERPDVVKVNGF